MTTAAVPPRRSSRCSRVVRLCLTLLAASSARAERVSFESFNFTNVYLGVTNRVGVIMPVVKDDDRRAATFRVAPGLADPSCLSLESAAEPGLFLRHREGRLRLEAFSDKASFKEDASFRLVPGLADPSLCSLESVNYPRHFIRHRDGQLYLESVSVSRDVFRKDATFRLVEPRTEWLTSAETNAAGRLVSLQPYALCLHYVTCHEGFRLWLSHAETDPASRRNATFRVVPGLADPRGLSLESLSQPGSYLRERAGMLTLSALEDSGEFRDAATFRLVPGLASVSWTSVELFNRPGVYLRHRDNRLYLENGEDEPFRREATFRLSPPQWDE